MTAEDIANSLYYIHLDSPEDGPPPKLPPRSRMDGISTRSSNESARSAIPRKPLPTSAKVLSPASPPFPAPPQSPPYRPEFENSGPVVVEQPTPVEGAVEGYRPNSTFDQHQAGPPSMPPPHGVPGSPPTTMPIERSEIGTRQETGHIASHPAPHFQTQPRPSTPNYPGSPPHYSRVVSPSSQLHQYRIQSPNRTGRRPASMTFSLTIIRRDPSSGSQVNVGKITSFATNIPTPDQADPTLDTDNMGVAFGSQKLNIHIATSGYAKYRGMPSRASADAQSQAFAQMIQNGGKDRPVNVSGLAAAPVEEGFNRQVAMAYSGGWKAGIKKAFQKRERANTTGGSPEVPQSPEDNAAPKPLHHRTGSASTVGSNHSASGEESGIITQPGPGLRPRGYFFLSPWEGRCEFRTSANGRSLKLGHVIDSTTKFQFDPREVAQNIQNAPTMGRSRGDELQAVLLGTKPVSELRFNLPSQGDFFGARKKDAESQNRSSRLSKQFANLLHREPKSSDEEWSDDDDDGDMDLGKEHAGGGHSGRKVKLGKLIIHDEGLKMLDLVVAANVGVWWTTWSRTES